MNSMFGSCFVLEKHDMSMLNIRGFIHTTSYLLKVSIHMVVMTMVR